MEAPRGLREVRETDYYIDDFKDGSVGKGAGEPAEPSAEPFADDFSCPVNQPSGQRLLPLLSKISWEWRDIGRIVLQAG